MTCFFQPFFFNPLSTKGDQHEISPYNINAFENGLVMRIEYMIREDESNWYFNNFSPPLLLKKYCWFSHDVAKIQTTKLSILLRLYFHGG